MAGLRHRLGGKCSRLSSRHRSRARGAEIMESGAPNRLVGCLIGHVP